MILMMQQIISMINKIYTMIIKNFNVVSHYQHALMQNIKEISIKSNKKSKNVKLMLVPL